MMHVWMKSLVDGLSYYGDLGHSLATVLSNPVGFLSNLTIICNFVLNDVHKNRNLKKITVH